MNTTDAIIENPAQIRSFFEENGYYLAKGVYKPEEVANLESSFDEIVRMLLASGENVNARWSGKEVEALGAQDSVVIHTHMVQKFSAEWGSALYRDRFLAVPRAILGNNIVLHHSKLFQKPAENGAPFPMHQDWGYFPTVLDTMMAGIIHVSSASDEMGCLRVYPGSHKLGRMEGSMGGTERLLAEYPIEKATIIEAEPGDVLFFHYFTIHGSMPNRSDKVRKTVLVQLHSGEDRCEDGVNHPNARLVLSGFNLHASRSEANLD